MDDDKKLCAWVVAVSMGYGHQRTAYPLKYLAPNGVFINANDYEGMPELDRSRWESVRKFYEFISRLKFSSWLGALTFSIFDHFQKIISFYPKVKNERTTFDLRQIFKWLKDGWGKDLIDKLAKNPLPFIATFSVPAFMAEYFNYPGEIYCVVSDTDVARPWVALNPEKSRIKYLAPTKRVAERLKLYGVKEGNIFLTGYPLPKENIGDNLEIVKSDLSERLLNLDPKGSYSRYFLPLIQSYIGKQLSKPGHILTLLLSIGGAGAQKEMAIQIVVSLKKKIKNKEIRLMLSAGAREEVKNYFENEIRSVGLERELNKGVFIISADNLDDYFKKFNIALRTTDILWTKPSELSFYCALGIPIIIAPPIGSQEDFNREWILRLGTGIDQKDLNYIDQWLFDLLDDGWFAGAAMHGYIEAEKRGVFNIEKIVCNKE
ncbi:MAG: hypothetical protein M1334_02830 [Patescibacteria group bacterium]|nr:hypothetical protein [Patescibacteria group bacterium]